MSATTFVLKRAGDSATARRAEHFFTETARVAEGAALWEAGDIAAFGQLMNASGRSSAHNYEAGPISLCAPVAVHFPACQGGCFNCFALIWHRPDQCSTRSSQMDSSGTKRR